MTFKDPNGEVMGALVDAHEGGMDPKVAVKEAVRACATFALLEASVTADEFTKMVSEAWVESVQRAKR